MNGKLKSHHVQREKSTRRWWKDSRVPQIRNHVRITSTIVVERGSLKSSDASSTVAYTPLQVARMPPETWNLQTLV